MGTGFSPEEAEGKREFLMEQRYLGGLPRQCSQCCASDQHRLTRAFPGSNILQEKKAMGGQAGPPSGSLGKDQEYSR